MYASNTNLSPPLFGYANGCADGSRSCRAISNVDWCQSDMGRESENQVQNAKGRIFWGGWWCASRQNTWGITKVQKEPEELLKEFLIDLSVHWAKDMRGRINKDSPKTQHISTPPHHHHPKKNFSVKVKNKSLMNYQKKKSEVVLRLYFLGHWK